MFHLATTVSTTATLGDLTRVVLTDELRDDETDYDMVGLLWLYARNGALAGTQRRIITSDAGHIGPMGAATLSRPLSAAIASGTTIDVTGPLPMKQAGSVKGLQECLIEGLRRIWVEALVTLTGNGTRSYSLDAYPWLVSEDQIRGIYDTVSDPSDVAALTPQRLRISTNNVSRTLITETIYDSATTFYLAVAVRASNLVYDGASWTYVTSLSGVSDTYQVACPERHALQFGLWRAARYARLWLKTVRMDPDRKAALLDEVTIRYRSAVSACKLIKTTEFPTPEPEPSDSMVSMPVVISWP